MQLLSGLYFLMLLKLSCNRLFDLLGLVLGLLQLSRDLLILCRLLLEGAADVLHLLQHLLNYP